MARLRPLSAFLTKEIRQSFRDPTMLFLLIALPVIQLLLYGYAVDLEVDRIGVAVADADGTPESRALARRFFADHTFEQRLAASAAESVRSLTRGEAAVALLVSPGFAGALQHGRPGEVQVVVDGTDPVRARAAVASAERFFATYTAERAGAPGRARPSAEPRVQIEPVVLFNSRLRSPPYMVPGAIGAVLLIALVQLTAMGVARERETGTLDQVLVSPLGHGSYILAKAIPFTAVGLVNVGILLSAAALLFDVPIHGSLPAVLLASFFYLGAVLGVGLLLGSVARTQQQAAVGAMFFIVPAFLLSGYFTPLVNAPPWFQALSYADPMRYYLEVLRACLVKGAGFVECATPIAALFGFAVVLLFVSARRFRKRLQHWSKGVSDAFAELEEHEIASDLEADRHSEG